ncbi:MAG: hypothetical protein GX913_07155 [Clostridiales bacterium]|nr:hypothetical protein [Clostridiales bacterium]
MKRNDYIKILKIAAGSSIAIIVANLLGLQYSTAAGVITLLTIQNTRKETLVIALKRFGAFLGAVVIAFIVFNILGYSPVTFGVFLLLFVALCFFFHLEDGLSICAVLITHFLIEESMSLYWVWNEFQLMIIGVGIGIILNLYIPSKMKSIKKIQGTIEDDMRLILKEIAALICQVPAVKYGRIDFEGLEKNIKLALGYSLDNINNSFRSEVTYFFQYMEMRRNQMIVLKRISNHICNLTEIPKQAYVIADFIHDTGNSFHEYNNVIKLLKGLESILQEMKLEPLPVSREEFENRAILLQLLFEFESFLVLKRDFVENLTEEQIEEYWNREEILIKR